MKTASINDFAIQAATSLGMNLIFIRTHCDGSSMRVSNAFPSITPNAIDSLLNDGFAAFHFDDEASAQTAYDQIINDLENESTLVAGEVNLVNKDGLKDRLTFNDWE